MVPTLVASRAELIRPSLIKTDVTAGSNNGGEG